MGVGVAVNEARTIGQAGGPAWRRCMCRMGKSTGLNRHVEMPGRTTPGPPDNHSERYFTDTASIALHTTAPLWLPCSQGNCAAFLPCVRPERLVLAGSIQLWCYRVYTGVSTQLQPQPLGIKLQGTHGGAGKGNKVRGGAHQGGRRLSPTSEQLQLVQAGSQPMCTSRCRTNPAGMQEATSPGKEEG